MTTYEVDNSIFQNTKLGYGQEGTPTSQYAKSQSPVDSKIVNYGRKALEFSRDFGRELIDTSRRLFKTARDNLIPQEEPFTRRALAYADIYHR